MKFMPAADRSERNQRPSPDALLEAAVQEGRGKLKIFLGAAPGVGKTYEMLQAAQAKRREAIDVVIGVVETHGRRETEALLAGLEVVPRRRVDYKGRMLAEMDLDRILLRRPRLVLVDELAHTNAPGGRHPKRYLDVEELLAAGIDVYTTLNIQHVESLNDVVAQITRIRVRETVPDSILDRADDIEVVDLSPEDLIQRLKEGKVYLPHQAERAVQHYFKPGNLTALRELALRRTAQRVDEQMLTYMRQHAISGPWAAGERVLVCVSEAPDCAALVRYAKRLADRLHAPWTALYVETARYHRLGEQERDRIADGLRLAEKLGGEAITIPGGRIAEDVVGYAQANNITHIVLGKSERSRWFEMLHGSVVHDLVRRAGNISVHVIAGGGEGAAPAATVATRQRSDGVDPRPYVATAAIIAVAVGVGLVLQQILSVQNISLVFLTGILVSAIRFGLLPSLFACLIGVLAYNFFFLPPIYTFTIADPENVVALFFFLIVAVIASNLAGRTRNQVLTARSRARTTEELFAFSRKLAGIATLDDLLWATVYQIASMLKVRVVLLLPAGRQHRGARGISARGPARRGRPRRGAMDLGAQPRRRARRRHAAGRQAPVPAAAHRARADRRARHRPRRARPAADARWPPPARRARRSGRGRYRAHHAGRGHRPRPRHRRDRAAARGAVDLDVARSAHAARLDHRLAHQPQELWQEL